jgi:hypothetical protein
MAFIRKSELTSLENEVRELRNETVRLTKQKCELDLKLFRTYGRELQEEIADRLNLTATQRSELALIFSVEHARIMGVPEEKILHNLEEVEKFFTAGES